MSRATEIGMADLLLALDTLCPEPTDDDTRLAIAHMLGFNWMPAENPAKRLGGEGSPAAQGGVIEDWRQGEWTGGVASGTEVFTVDESMPVDLEPIEETRNAEDTDFSWIHELNAEEVGAPSPGPATATSRSPLFRRNWQRGILQAATSLVEAGRAIHIERLVDLSAARQAVARLPRRSRSTLRHGIQLLLDTSRSMAPCLGDHQPLLRELQNLFPPERCQVQHFLECPSRGVIPAGGDAAQDYELPARPRVVLVVSDFGAAPERAEPDAVAVEEWLDFANQLIRANCPFVAISPYGRRHWHPALAARADVITWDRGTTIAQVSRARRRGR